MIGYTLERLYQNVKKNPKEETQRPLVRTLLYTMWTEPRVSMLMNQPAPAEFFHEVEQVKLA
jgi:hypothetical protein